MEDIVQTVVVDRKETKRFNSRKFMFAVGIWAAGTIGWAAQIMNTAEWIELSKWMLLIYVTGNVSESALEYLRK